MVETVRDEDRHVAELHPTQGICQAIDTALNDAPCSKEWARKSKGGPCPVPDPPKCPIRQ